MALSRLAASAWSFFASTFSTFTILWFLCRCRHKNHKIRNLESKVPQERWREIKATALAAHQAASPKLAECAARIEPAEPAQIEAALKAALGYA
jgi:hypothetical protein